MKWRDKIPMLIIGFLLLSSILLFSFSCLPFSFIKPRIDSLSGQGSAEIFTEEFFTNVTQRGRLYALVFLLLSGIIFKMRLSISNYLSTLQSSFLPFLMEQGKTCVKAIAKDTKMHWFALIVIVLSAVLFRIYFLAQPMKFDESFTFLNYASRPIVEGLSNYTFPNNHLFHTFLVHVSYMILGNKPWVIRLPALLAGVSLVLASYLVTRLLYNKNAALMAAALISSSSVLINYSTDARGYVLICLFFMILLALGSLIIENNANVMAWLLLSVFSSLGFHTIPIMLYPYGIVLIWIFLSSGLKDKLLLKHFVISLIVTCLLTAFLYFPVLLMSGLDALVANPAVTSKSWTYVAANSPNSLREVWSLWNEGVPDGVQYCIALGFFISLVFHRRLSKYRGSIIAALVLWVVPLLVIQQTVPPERVWLFLLPVYFAMASAGICFVLHNVALNNKVFNAIGYEIAAIATSLLLGFGIMQMGLYYYSRLGTFKNAEEITLFLKDYLKSGDKVLVKMPSDAPLAYYFKLHQVPSEYLFNRTNSNERLLVIVNRKSSKPQDQTIDGMMSDEYFSGRQKNPRLVQSYDASDVFEFVQSVKVDD